MPYVVAALLMIAVVCLASISRPSPRRASLRSSVMPYCCAIGVQYASETDASAQPPGISKPTGRPSRTMSSGSVAERIRNRTRGAFFRKKAM
jgi:hypothetical protein